MQKCRSAQERFAHVHHVKCDLYQNSSTAVRHHTSVNHFLSAVLQCHVVRCHSFDVCRTHHWKLRCKPWWTDRDLSDSWTGFTQFTLLEEKPPDGYMWSGWRLTKRQVTYRPDHLWPELWIKLGRNAELKEKHKWAIEKPKLDTARRLRGIYFIDPEDKEFKKTIKNAGRKLRTPMAPPMPCKKNKHGETRTKTTNFKSKLACLLEASESTRLRVEESLPNYHEDHIARKGAIHCNIIIWYTNLFLCLKP